MTRHVDAEMRESDWNTMILHYLGLDHIGHKSGPRRYAVLDRVNHGGLADLTYQL